MMNHNIAERDESICLMARANVYSLKESAEMFSVSESTIKRVCKASNLPYDPNRNALLELARSKRFTVPELAELLGYAPEHTKNILHKKISNTWASLGLRISPSRQ